MSIGRHYADSNTKSSLNREEDESFAYTVDLLQQQITLEYKLQATCQDLLYHYKESHNWVAVSQIAQNLITNSHRIDVLKKELLTVRAGCVLSPGLDSIKESEDTGSEGGEIFPESIEVEAEHFDFDAESGGETEEEEKPVKLENPVSTNEANMSELESPLPQNHVNEVRAKVESAQHSNPPSSEIEESFRTTAEEESCRDLETNYKPDCRAAGSPKESNCFTSGENARQFCIADEKSRGSSPEKGFQQEGFRTPGEDSQASLAPGENSSAEIDNKPTYSGSTPPPGTEDCEGTAESCKHLESSPEEFHTTVEITEVISDQTVPVDKHPHPSSDTMSEAATITLNHNGSEATKRRNRLSNLALTVHVSRVLDADSGEVSYLVDTHNLDPSATEPKQSISHSLKEFCELREQLATKRELPELDIPNCESCKVDGVYSEEDVCKKLEKFLNTVICDPILRGEPTVVCFLIETKVPPLSPEEPQADKDERKQESVPLQSEPTPLNDRDLHSFDVQTGSIPSAGDSSQGSGHHGPESNPEMEPVSHTSEQGEGKEEGEGEMQESKVDPASHTSEPGQEEEGGGAETHRSEVDPASHTSEPGQGEEEGGGAETHRSEVDPAPHTTEPGQGEEEGGGAETHRSEVDPAPHTTEPGQGEEEGGGAETHTSEIGPTSCTNGQEEAEVASEGQRSEIDLASRTSRQEQGEEEIGGGPQSSEIDLASRTKEQGKEEEGGEEDNHRSEANQASQGEEKEDKGQGSAETDHPESADTRGLVDSTSSDTAVTLSSSGGKAKLSRSESNPIIGGVAAAHDDSVLHLSLTPLSPTSPKAASSDNIVDDDDLFSDHNGLKKRQRSVPSFFKRPSRSGSVIRQLSQRIKTKWKTTNYEGESSIVEVPKNIPTQEWDPTCLLEELYSDHKPGAAQSNPSGESARYFGYMEKLPINQSKSTVMKGWKRRYFRAMEGNIFYYEERTSEKPLGCTRLSNSKIICNAKKCQIQVTEKNGRFLMIKAPDVEELNAWHRALKLEAAHPTMVSSSNLSPQPQKDNPVVIIDIGACSVRAGFAGENAYPQLFFPAVCSIDASTNDPIDCGLNAFLPQNRYGARLIYPRKHSLRMDHQNSSVKITAVHAIIESVLLQLNVQARDCYLLLVLPSTVPEQERSGLIELLLETFAFSGIYLQEQAILALYSYNTTSGVVVDMGDHMDVVPVIDGYVVEAGITRLPFGGNAITENISKLITTKGVRYFSETEMYINRFIKESLCFVSQDYADDCAKCDASPAEYTRAVDVDRFQLPDHRKVVALDNSLFQAPEGLFNPIQWGKDVPGVHEAVWKALQACPIDQRKELSRKVFLSGGTSLLPGLQERLKQELISLSPQGTNVEVHASETRQHAAYLGASVLSSLSSFQNMLLTQDEWSTLGMDALKKWSIS